MKRDDGGGSIARAELSQLLAESFASSDNAEQRRADLPEYVSGTDMLVDDRYDEITAVIKQLRSLTVGIDQSGAVSAIPGPFADAVLKMYNLATRQIEFQIGLVCNVLEALVEEIFQREEAP